MSERTNGLTPEQIRAMFDNCMRRLDDYHFVQCMRRPRCTCHLAIVKDAILANFNAMHNAGIAAERERAARVCDDRAIVYDGLEDAASTRYFADKMRGAREGSEQCAAAIRALVEGKP